MPHTTCATRPRRTAVRAAWLFDGTSANLIPDPLVLLDGPTITSVESHGTAPEDADLIDIPGATLLPGLVDTHVHLAFDAGLDPVASLAARDDAAVLDAMREAGRAALRGGVTTVRDLGDRDYLSLALRGEPGLPTIVAAGPPITSPVGHCHFLGGSTVVGPEALRAAVREHVEHGVDVIKIMASGGTMTPGSRQELSQFAVQDLRDAVDEAHRHGLPITAHAHGTAAIREAIAADVDGMEHVSFWSEDGVDDPGELVDVIADRRIVVGATLGMVPVPGLVPPPGLISRIPYIIANTRRLYEAGAVIVAGTDAGIAPVKPHDVLRHAMPQLLALGFTAAEALQTMTSVAADVCGLAHRKGRIAVGFDADVLVVDGDPISDPDALHRVREVFARGVAVGTGPSLRSPQVSFARSMPV